MIEYILEPISPRDPSASSLRDAWTFSFSDQKVLIDWEKISEAFSKTSYPTEEAALDAYWENPDCRHFSCRRDGRLERRFSVILEVLSLGSLSVHVSSLFF